MFLNCNIKSHQENISGGKDPKRRLWLLLSSLLPLVNSCRNGHSIEELEQIDDQGIIANNNSVQIRDEIIKDTYQETLGKYAQGLNVDGQDCLFVKDIFSKKTIISEGQGYWLRLTANLAQSANIDSKQAQDYQENFEKMKNGYLALVNLAKQNGNQGEFAAWAADIKDGKLVPAKDNHITPGPLNCAADADFDFINSLILAQQNVEAGIWNDQDYSTLIESFADYAQKNLINDVNGRLLFKVSEDWQEDYYFIDYFSPETALNLATYFKDKDLEKAKFWQQVAGDALEVYAQAIKQTGQIPKKAKLNISPNGEIKVALIEGQSYDGIRGPWRIASAVRLLKNNLDPKIKEIFSKYVDTYDDDFQVDMDLQQIMYLPLALALERNDIVEAIMTNQKIQEKQYTYKDLAIYFQTTLTALSLVDNLAKNPQIKDFVFETITDDLSWQGFSNKDKLTADDNFYYQVGDYGFVATKPPYNLQQDYEEVITSQSLTMGIFKAIQDNDKAKFQKLVNTAIHLSTLNYFATDRFTGLLPWTSIYDETLGEFRIVNYQSKDYHVDGRASAADVDIDLLTALILGFNKFDSIFDKIGKENFRNKLVNFIYNLAKDMSEHSCATVNVGGVPKYLLKTSSFIDTKNDLKFYNFNFTAANISFLKYIATYFQRDFEYDRISGNEFLADFFNKLAADSQFFINQADDKFDGLDNLWGTVTKDHINLVIEQNGKISISVATKVSDIYRRITEDAKVKKVFTDKGYINSRDELTPAFFKYFDQENTEAITEKLKGLGLTKKDDLAKAIVSFLKEMRDQGIEKYRYQWRILGKKIDENNLKQIPQLSAFDKKYLPVVMSFDQETMSQQKIGFNQQYKLSEVDISNKVVFNGNDSIREATINGSEVISFSKKVNDIEYVIEVSGEKFRLAKVQKDKRVILTKDNNQWFDLTSDILATGSLVITHEMNYFRELLETVKKQINTENSFKGSEAGRISTYAESSMAFPSTTALETGTLSEAMYNLLYLSLEGGFTRITRAAFDVLMTEAFLNKDVKNLFHKSKLDRDISFIDFYIRFLREKEGMNDRQILNVLKTYRGIAFENWTVDLDFLDQGKQADVLVKLNDLDLIIQETVKQTRFFGSKVRYRVVADKFLALKKDKFKELLENTNLNNEEKEQLYQSIKSVHANNKVVRALDSEYLMLLSKLSPAELEQLKSQNHFQSFFELNTLFEELKTDFKQDKFDQVFTKMKNFITFYFGEEKFELQENNFKQIVSKPKESAINLYNYLIDNFVEITINKVISNYQVNNNQTSLLQQIRTEIEQITGNREIFNNFKEVIAGKILFDDKISLSNKQRTIADLLSLKPDKQPIPHLEIAITTGWLLNLVKQQNNPQDVNYLIDLLISTDEQKVIKAQEALAKKLNIKQGYLQSYRQKISDFIKQATTEIKQSKTSSELSEKVYTYEYFVYSLIKTLSGFDYAEQANEIFKMFQDDFTDQDKFRTFYCAGFFVEKDKIQTNDQLLVFKDNLVNARELFKEYGRQDLAEQLKELENQIKEKTGEW